MRETITAPEYLRAREIVREIVVVDCVFFGAVSVYILWLNAYMLLLFGLFALVPLLICDLGCWTLDPDDLRRRTILGGAGLVGSLATALMLPRVRDLLPLFGGFAVLCAVSLVVFPWARRIAVRHQPVHHGGGGRGAGKAAIDASANPPASGLPSGWVGRRRFF